MNQPLTNLAKQLGCSLIALRPHHQQTYRNMHTAADKTVGTMYVHMFADSHVVVHRCADALNHVSVSFLLG